MVSDIRLDEDSVIVDGMLKVDQIRGKDSGVYIPGMTTRTIAGAFPLAGHPNGIVCHTDGFAIYNPKATVKQSGAPGIALFHEPSDDSLVLNKHQKYRGGVSVEGELKVFSLTTLRANTGMLDGKQISLGFEKINLIDLLFKMREQVNDLTTKLDKLVPQSK